MLLPLRRTVWLAIVSRSSRGVRRWALHPDLVLRIYTRWSKSLKGRAPLPLAPTDDSIFFSPTSILCVGSDHPPLACASNHLDFLYAIPLPRRLFGYNVRLDYMPVMLPFTLLASHCFGVDRPNRGHDIVSAIVVADLTTLCERRIP